jgi:hypothetical protein
MKFRFSLLGLLGLTTLCGLAAGALVQPSSLWLSLIVSLTVLAIIVQTVRVLLAEGQSRAAAVGWLLFAVSYLAIALGPWLSANLGPQLATSRGIDFALERIPASDANLSYSGDQSGNVFQTPRFNLNSVNTVNASGLDVNYDVLVANQLVTNMSGLVGHEYRRYYFTHSAHWLAAWLTGWLGAAIAVQLASRRDERAARATLGGY